MNMVTYEKPRMTFVSLRNESKVAATCWGYHGTTTRLFCDIEGEGFMSFQIEEGSCALNLIHVRYHPETEEEYFTPTQAQIDELNTILVRSGGSQGNSYKDMGITVLPGDPDPEWS